MGIVVAGAIVAGMGQAGQDLTRIGNLPHGLPAAGVPMLTGVHINALLPGAIALALLGLLEAYSIGKSLAIKTGMRIDANQELFSQGLTNALSSVFGCIPGSGSFSRSALNHYVGAKTRFAGAFNGLFVLVIFLVFSKWAQFIPTSALAAILFVIAYALIDWRFFLRVSKTSRRDATVCLITFIATLGLPLAWAIYVGIFLNIAMYLQRASQLHLAEMVRTPAGPFIERPIPDRAGNRKVMFLGVEGELFFGVADQLEQRLTALANSGVRVIILRLKRTHSIDSTVLQVLDRFAKDLQQHGGHLILCGLKHELLEVVRAYGLNKTVGDENIFETTYGVFTSAKRALARAQQLVDDSIDMEALNGEDDLEGWAYEI
jgi:SulP family sulfate permease